MSVRLSVRNVICEQLKGTNTLHRSIQAGVMCTYTEVCIPVKPLSWASIQSALAQCHWLNLTQKCKRMIPELQ